MGILAYLAAIAVGLAGIALAIWFGAVAKGLAAVRDVFRAFLTDDTPRGARELSAAAAERIRNPLLRRIVTRRVAEMAGTMLVQQIVNRLADQIRAAWITAAVGVALLVFAFFVPGLLL
jgi:predicted phage tail protein